jgi:hypothetical protein
LLTGFLSGSLVSARALSPKEARSVPLPLVNGNFDAAQPPATDGPPREFAQWGGDFSRVTGEDQGIRPPNGRRMLRFLRADNSQSPKTKGQAASELWQWLEEGAHFYVCGDAKRMAKDVDDALHQIIETQGDKTAEEAD